MSTPIAPASDRLVAAIHECLKHNDTLPMEDVAALLARLSQVEAERDDLQARNDRQVEVITDLSNQLAERESDLAVLRDEAVRRDQEWTATIAQVRALRDTFTAEAFRTGDPREALKASTLDVVLSRLTEETTHGRE